MRSRKESLLIHRQLGQVRAVGVISSRFRYTTTSRTVPSTLFVPTSGNKRRPFSSPPLHLQPNLLDGIRTIFIQTESTPNVDVGQSGL